MNFPRMGDLLECTESAVVFPYWDYDGEKPGWIRPGTMAIFLEERADYSNDFTVFWKVITTDGKTGWAPSISFKVL